MCTSCRAAKGPPLTWLQGVTTNTLTFASTLQALSCECTNLLSRTLSSISKPQPGNAAATQPCTNVHFHSRPPLMNPRGPEHCLSIATSRKYMSKSGTACTGFAGDQLSLWNGTVNSTSLAKGKQARLPSNPASQNDIFLSTMLGNVASRWGRRLAGKPMQQQGGEGGQGKGGLRKEILQNSQRHEVPCHNCSEQST